MIPAQLSNEYFCKIPSGQKGPKTLGWQNLRFTIETAEQWLSEGNNYGVLTGLNNLAILDDDSEDNVLHTLFKQHFSESFQVRGHIYIRLNNWNGETTRYFDPKTGEKLGELLGKGAQGVGPHSTHPSGEKYKIISDVPIITIDFADYNKFFNQFVPVKKEKLNSNIPKVAFEGDKVQDIPLTNLISTAGYHTTSFGYQGTHPIHGSTGGLNFTINKNLNCWHCFRCDSGGGPSELIGVLEGIIPCCEAGSNCFTQDQASKVIEIAREKYGLKAPEKKDLGPVKGWANSISIESLAKKHNLSCCPTCNSPLSFKDSHGLYYCKTCKKGGGLRQFAELIAEKQNETK